MTPADRQRVAQLAAWREHWLALGMAVQRRAEERAQAWVERHIPERYYDCMPFQFPERLQIRHRRREDLFAERLDRSNRHLNRANACEREIARIRAEAKARQPKQAPLFADVHP